MKHYLEDMQEYAADMYDPFTVATGEAKYGYRFNCKGMTFHILFVKPRHFMAIEHSTGLTLGEILNIYRIKKRKAMLFNGAGRMYQVKQGIREHAEIIQEALQLDEVHAEVEKWKQAKHVADLCKHDAKEINITVGGVDMIIKVMDVKLYFKASDTGEILAMSFSRLVDSIKYAIDRALYEVKGNG